MKYKVTAPEAAYDGNVGNVQFTDGSAVIDEDTHPNELAYCRTAGYRVEEADGEEPKQAEKPAEKTETKSAPARRAPAKKEGEK